MTVTERFEQARPRLMRLAYSELGDVGEAEDVVQEAWLRLERVDVAAIENLDGWLTKVVARLALDRLRSARVRRESYVGPWLPEPLAPDDPAERVTLDESVSYALLTVLERLSPAERTAFVLHDVFDMPFGDIAEVVGRTPAGVRQLASRARHRVRRERHASRRHPTSTNVQCAPLRGRLSKAISRGSSRCSIRKSSGRRTAAVASPPPGGRYAGECGSRGRGPRSAPRSSQTQPRSSSTAGSACCSRAATVTARRCRSSSATVASAASPRSATRRSCGTSRGGRRRGRRPATDKCMQDCRTTGAAARELRRRARRCRQRSSRGSSSAASWPGRTVRPSSRRLRSRSADAACASKSSANMGNR